MSMISRIFPFFLGDFSDFSGETGDSEAHWLHHSQGARSGSSQIVLNFSFIQIHRMIQCGMIHVNKIWKTNYDKHMNKWKKADRAARKEHEKI